MTTQTNYPMRSAGVKFSFLLFLFFCVNLLAQTPYEVTDKDYKPKKQLVHDFGNMFDAAQREQLERKLVAYDDSTSVQIVVVTFKQLDGYPIELLANEIGEKWGVGQKEKHNGIVIVLSNDDRKVTLRGGYGIQAKMPPTVEKIIIDQEMIPAFKQGDYYGGVDNATTAISKVLAGKYDAEPKEHSEPYGFLFFLIFIGFIVLFIIIASKGGGGGKGGNRGKRGFNWTDVILTSGGASTWGSGGFGGGSSGGGFGGGGFGGFGGGSFGGGGASGSW